MSASSTCGISRASGSSDSALVSVESSAPAAALPRRSATATIARTGFQASVMTVRALTAMTIANHAPPVPSASAR